MDAKSWTPYGLALLDFLNGKTAAQIIVHEADGRKRKMPASTFFRTPPEFPLLESTALSLCRGRVLDIGAGAGCHSLALQEQGFSVCAIDISSKAVEVMRMRGVKEVYCTDIFNFKTEKPFDTILMMMNGIGVVENPDALGLFLNSAHSLLRSGGQILLDSSDMRDTARNVTPSGLLSYPDSKQQASAQQASDRQAPAQRASDQQASDRQAPSQQASDRQASNQQSGRYIGEVKFQMEYKGKKGSPFWWLFVDPDMLTEKASKAGWSCEVIYREWDGHYLSRLLSL
ncbi:MAG: class I SAM-dependent methyltransferase [bacterium]